MKVLFVVDINNYAGFKPIGVMCLSSILKKEGHEVRVSDIQNPDLERIVIDYDPHFLAYSLCSGSEEGFLKVNRRLKRLLSKKVISVFGGPHTSFFPDIINEDGVDVICRGEGEEAIVELVNGVQSGKDWYDIENLWAKKGISIIKNECRPLKMNLDEYPVPDRGLFNNIPEALDYIEYVVTSRGCPYDCSYCFNYQFKDLYGLNAIKIRRRSVDNVILELEELKEFNDKIQFIQFEDDIFSFDKDWLVDFKEKYLSEIGLPFSVNYRPNVVKEENVKLLYETGCRQITIAVESGNEFTRNSVLNRRMSEKVILHAAQIIKHYKIFFLTQNILGNPVEDSFADACDTFRLNNKIQPDYAWASLLNPYYGTKIWEYCVQHGFMDIKEKFPLTYHCDSPLKLKDIKKILNFYELFSLMVSFPILFQYRNYLCNLPLRSIYKILRKLWKGYRYNQRYSLKLSSKEFIGIGLKYLFGKGG